MAGEGTKGWVSIYRAIEDGWLWKDKPFARGQAWIDLLLQANHKDNKIFSKGELIEVKRGSFLTSDQELSDRWGWSRKKVRTFLSTLKKEKMVSLNRSPKGTCLSIEKYSFYQDRGKTEDTTEEQQRVQQRNTNNNDNNVNNDNKYIYSSESNEYRLAVYLFNYIRKNNDKAKEPKFNTWAKEFNKIIRIDNRDLEEVKQVIKFSQTDSFWYANILSPKKLREKYDQLLLKMKAPKVQTNYKGKGSTFNNFEQRNYDFDKLERQLLGWEDPEE